jgi:prepilin peptidase CpaA
MVLTTLVIAVAIATDLRWRRIPNTLTFSALGAALVVRCVFQGWIGLGSALAGAAVAPIFLLVIHIGRGMGMGDLKLAAAVGAFLGPTLALVAMLLTAVAGGLLAIALLCRRGQLFSELFSLFLIGVPFLQKRLDRSPASSGTPAPTMPYAVAIGIGSLATLVVYACSGPSLISFVGIAATQ